MAILNIRRNESIVILELNRPEARNALNEEVLSALGQALVTFRYDDSVRAVVLHGAAGNFCSGADITAFDRIREDALIGPRKSLLSPVTSSFQLTPRSLGCPRSSLASSPAVAPRSVW